MRNAEIADALAELATLYELDGAIRYRVLAYREAARVIRQSPVSVEELARAGRATELPGVGETLEQKILALVDTGEIPSGDEAEAKVPAVAGRGDAGPRGRREDRAPPLRRARRARASTTCAPPPSRSGSASSRASARRSRRTCSRRSASSPTEGRPSGCSSRRSCRWPSSSQTDLRAHPASDAVEVAGSARRRTETCHDIDLIATASRARRRWRGRCSTIRWRRPRARPATAGPGSRPTTGSRSTCGSSPPTPTATCFSTSPARPSTTSSCASAPSAMGLSVSEHGITDTESGEVARYATEAEVYERLGLAYIEPELREANGEIAAAADGHAARRWSRIEDIRGDLHCHTTLSDGHNTLEEMAEAARARGYAYLAVTDHSASHGFGNHVTPTRLRRADRGGAGVERRAAAASGCSPARR